MAHICGDCAQLDCICPDRCPICHRNFTEAPKIYGMLWAHNGDEWDGCNTEFRLCCGKVFFHDAETMLVMGFPTHGLNVLKGGNDGESESPLNDA